MTDKKLDDKVREFMVEMSDVEILKTTEAYGYFYAALPDIIKVITPILIKHGIWYKHRTGYDAESKCNLVITRVYNINDSNDFEESITIIDKEAQLAKMNRFMIEGSAITYFRRYHLTTMLGLQTDEDSDAGGKRVKKQSGTGRSVEANSEPEKPNMVAIFDKQIELKNKVQINKLFDMYKPQMNNAEIKAISQLIENKHGNK